MKSKNKIKLPKGADFTVDEKLVKVSALFCVYGKESHAGTIQEKQKGGWSQATSHRPLRPAVLGVFALSREVVGFGLWHG